LFPPVPGGAYYSGLQISGEEKMSRILSFVLVLAADTVKEYLGL
jgi:hypothetical protein